MPHLDANGIGHHYRFDGPEDGPVVMLSNSLATNLAMWEPQVPALTGAGYRVLRYDSRGHGQSGLPAGPYSMDLLAEDAVALLDALSVERVHYCGLSQGGMIGQTLGVRHPGRMISLTLADTAARTGVPEAWTTRIEAVRAGGMETVVEATLERWLTAEGRARMPEWADAIADMVRSTPVEGYCASAMAIRDMDQRETIRAIVTPTLVVVGEQDFGTPVEAARLIHERIAGSTLAILPNAAHLSNIDNSPAFNRELLAFVQARS